MLNLEHKKYVLTGVLTQSSIAFSVARVLQESGAEIVLTSFGKAMRLTERTAARLPMKADVLELDVTRAEHLIRLTDALSGRWGRIDGALHSIAFAPESCLGGSFLRAEWPDVAVAMNVSAYSLKALAHALLPLMEERGGSIVGLDADAAQVLPGYNWMGVAKAALEATSRYLANELGGRNIRVNLVAAGPISSMAANAIPEVVEYARIWKARAPLGWDCSDAEPIARACSALLSDLFPATTGEIIHVDGGAHAVGAGIEEPIMVRSMP